MKSAVPMCEQNLLTMRIARGSTVAILAARKDRPATTQQDTDKKMTCNVIRCRPDAAHALSKGRRLPTAYRKSRSSTLSHFLHVVQSYHGELFDTSQTRGLVVHPNAKQIAFLTEGKSAAHARCRRAAFLSLSLSSSSSAWVHSDSSSCTLPSRSATLSWTTGGAFVRSGLSENVARKRS